MPDAAQVLRDNGIVADPLDVIAASRGSGLELAAVAAKLKRESYGGKNVFGHDRVPTGGTYTPGGWVNPTNYAAYRAWSGAASGRQQGVGPAQLTYRPFQVAADQRGGCHVPRFNMEVGAQELVRCLKVGGGSYREAGARYNGGTAYAKASTAAQEYGRWLETEVVRWRRLLDATDRPVPAVLAETAGLPTLAEGATGSLVASLQAFLNKAFPAYSRIDLGPRRLGPQTVEVLEEFQRRSGIPTTPPFAVGAKTWAALAACGFRP